MQKWKHWKWALALSLAALLASCGGYDGLNQQTGQQGILDQANLYLNAAQCDQAITILTPLYRSQYVSNDVRMTMSSAYACKAGFSFPTVLSAMITPGSNIYQTLTKAYYTVGPSQAVTNYTLAAQYIRETSSVAGSFEAGYRTDDANIYMIFVQIGALMEAMNELGAPDRTTGAKSRTIASQARNSKQDCAAQIAFATILNSFASLSVVAAAKFTTVKNTLSALCVGSYCTNLDPDACNANPNFATYGDLLLLSIDPSW